MLTERRGSQLVCPGFATAHSHAFQRGLRGRTHRAETSAGGPGSFWSWRGGMYRLAEQLDPDSIYALSHFAFVELALAGVTAVGEFHYVHHDPSGAPYAERTELAEAVIRAARDAGLRIALLRVLYHRAGAGAPAEGAQRRFSDGDVDDALADAATLASRYADDPAVSVGIAPHSIRAVPLSWVAEAARFAADRDLPFHMHVAEQRRELDECIAEHGMPPVRLLAESGVLSERFVAVHATHLEGDEIDALGRARSFVCLCRTTERDLGDGLCPTGPLLAAGARLCTGVDSHAISDPFEEIRAVELDERSRTERRNTTVTATELLHAATRGGYAAIGLGSDGDEVTLDAGDPALAGARDDWLDDAVVFAAGPRAVHHVAVAGQRIVEAGVHPRLEAAREAYERTLRNLMG